eukprot:767637-Hanusia_phi.AAC.2
MSLNRAFCGSCCINTSSMLRVYTPPSLILLIQARQTLNNGRDPKSANAKACAVLRDELVSSPHAGSPSSLPSSLLT